MCGTGVTKWCLWRVADIILPNGYGDMDYYFEPRDNNIRYEEVEKHVRGRIPDTVLDDLWNLIRKT